ncbi:MAG TPA: hypothetical protein VFX30_09265 [bacterium]|nr:hypothetical protein [bacterium]
MNSLFTGGLPVLSEFVGRFSLNPLGYPRVAVGSPAVGWRPATLSVSNQEEFVAGLRAVREDAERFVRKFKGGRDEYDIPDTSWKLEIVGPDQFRLWRPRFALHFDLSPAPWTDLVELRKEYLPEAGVRRLISQKFRRTRSEAEPFREIKEMKFARVEINEEFGGDQRAFGMLEHQLTLQFNANYFQTVKAAGGVAIALSPRDPLIDRWKPHSGRPPAGEVDQDAPTPAQGIPVTDPDYPYRVLYERDPPRDYFRIYMSRREPDNAALALELGLRTLWNRVETFVETTDRRFVTVRREPMRR